MKRVVGILMIFILVFLSFASAKVEISDVEGFYSLGDRVYIDVVATPSSVYGNFNINLICGSKELAVYKIPAEPSFTAGEEQRISTYLPLTKDYIGNLTGDCYLQATIGGEEALSDDFQISDSVNIDANFNKQYYDAGESISLIIEVTKANGDLLNGFVEASGVIDFAKAIEEGKLEHTFTMPETSEAGSYNLNLFIYDKNDNGILNSGNTSVNFKINQVASLIQLSLSEREIIPGDNLTVGADIFDQSGKKMNGSVVLDIKGPMGEEISRNVKSGGFATIDFKSNESAGVWGVSAFGEGVEEYVEFEIEEVQKVKYDFIDSILVIKNIGNSVFDRVIEVKIGDNIHRLDLNMQLGEERRFNLEAPNGEYGVVISDGEQSVEKDILLTGNAVNVKDLDSTFVGGYGFVWVLIIFLLAAGGVFLFFKYKGSAKLKKHIKTTEGNFNDSLQRTKKSPESQSIDYKESSMKKGVSEAESSLVLKGQKQMSSVVAINVKNYASLKDNAKSELVRIISYAKEHKGLVDWKEDYIFIVFSPLITKTFKNEILAVKTGHGILKKLKEYNKKFSDKINFNIGINSGDLIASKGEGKLKYTGIGNTISYAKKLSILKQGELLVSEGVKSKLMRVLKISDKGEVNKKNYYSVEDIQDNSANQDKLKSILKRMKRE